MSASETDKRRRGCQDIETTAENSLNRCVCMPFLRAQWLDLVMVNWEVPRVVLLPRVPQGTELDEWRGMSYLSLVCFRFANTRIVGVRVPGHTEFEEVNLRFYVKRECAGELRRGVVFIKEIVPRACVSFIARTVYNENYVTARMSHEISREAERVDARYRWSLNRRNYQVGMTSRVALREMVPGSHQEFIAEHYWGYCRQRDGRTLEYRVDHPIWRFVDAEEVDIECDGLDLYGREVGTLMSKRPATVFYCDGSEIAVAWGRRI